MKSRREWSSEPVFWPPAGRSGTTETWLTTRLKAAEGNCGAHGALGNVRTSKGLSGGTAQHQS